MEEHQPMNIYIISQSENGDYDTYDAAVVAAPDMETARHMHPNKGAIDWSCHTWASGPEHVRVRCIGETNEPQGVLLASFNAG
jgi:hypothetical protein